MSQIVDIGDGIPFVVEELAAARGRPGLSSLAAVAEARLGSLSAGARRLVEAAALGDGQLVWPLLEDVVDLAPEELDEAVLGAVRAGILEETSTHDGVRFRHALLRDAADRSIPPAARRGWHRRWAQAITDRPGVLPADPALMAVANHWHCAGDLEREAVAALAAIEPARRTGGGAEELRTWERLVELWPHAAQVMEPAGITHHLIVARILRLALSLGATPETLHRVDRLEEAVIDDLERAAIEIRRSLLNQRYYDPEAVPRDRFADVEPALRAALPDPLARDALALLAAYSSPEDPRGDEVLAEMREIARVTGDESAVLVDAARQALRFEGKGDIETAICYLESALDSAREVGTFELWVVDGVLIWFLGVAGRYAEAETAIERAIGRVLDPISAGLSFEHIVECATFCWVNTGQWTRADRLIRSGQPYWGEGTRMADVRLAGLELLRTGQLSDPDRWLAAIDQPQLPGCPPPRRSAEVVGWHAAYDGDLTTMREHLAATWVATDPAGSSDLWSPVLTAVRFESDAAVRRPDPDDRDAAEEHVATIEGVAERIYWNGDVGHAGHAELAAQLARFRGEPGRDLFETAVVAWEHVGHPYDAAVARLCLAEAEVGENRDAARRHAEATLATARELGAGPLARDAEDFLKRYRLASRSVETPGRPGALTAREREVLALLAEGRTNEQIASDLFMSPKTASVHVSRILTKLGVGNRTEAAAVARRIGLL